MEECRLALLPAGEYTMLEVCQVGGVSRRVEGNSGRVSMNCLVGGGTGWHHLANSGRVLPVDALPE